VYNFIKVIKENKMKILFTMMVLCSTSLVFAVGGTVNSTENDGNYCSVVSGNNLTHHWCDSQGVTCGAVGGDCTVNGISGKVVPGKRPILKEVRKSR
jgi:hypothetical protein